MPLPGARKEEMIGRVYFQFKIQTVFIMYRNINYFDNEHTNDQLTVGLIASLVKHCTDIVAVIVSNPVNAWLLFLFFQALFSPKEKLMLCNG